MSIAAQYVPTNGIAANMAAKAEKNVTVSISI
jgi:hypothetical protein